MEGARGRVEAMTETGFRGERVRRMGGISKGVCGGRGGKGVEERRGRRGKRERRGAEGG